jgi:hypothetical protein
MFGFVFPSSSQWKEVRRQWTSTYIAVVFLKNCLVTSAQKCDDFEIVPTSGIGASEEIALMDQYLSDSGFEKIGGAEALSETVRREQPAALVRFPKIFATSPGECMEVAVNNAKTLSDLLALQRDNYSTVVGTIVIDAAAGLYWFWLCKPTYTGNLVGGFLGGEDPSLTQRHLAKVRENESLRLYLKLYRDAVAEQDVEMAYYRYWAILEVMAAAKHFSDAPIVDRHGNTVLNRRGGIRRVTDEAQPRVTELLRRVYKAMNVSMSYGLGHLFDLIPIWYRHRNCIAHCGGCRPDDPAHCHRDKPQFIACRDMHLLVVNRSNMQRSRHSDDLLRHLESAVKLAVIHELK